MERAQNENLSVGIEFFFKKLAVGQANSQIGMDEDGRQAAGRAKPLCLSPASNLQIIRVCFSDRRNRESHMVIKQV